MDPIRKIPKKVTNRQFFHRKTVFHMKMLPIINFTTKLLSIKDYFLNNPNRKITKKFTKKFDSRVINRQYFHRKTGLKSLLS